MALRHVNAVVVGAGAGGGIVAQRLAEAGLTVVLLERGGWVGFEAHGPDQLITPRVPVLGNGFGPADRHPRVAETAPGKWVTVAPNDGGYGNNAACVGSGTVSYGAMAWRFMEHRTARRVNSVSDRRGRRDPRRPRAPRPPRW